MNRANEKEMNRESHIKQIIAKVREICSHAIEDCCVQPAYLEELEEMLFCYVK
jgi:hypothetical protein